jgi:multidrug efflux pump subunit AcrA (membrane-fusion protein)
VEEIDMSILKPGKEKNIRNWVFGLIALLLVVFVWLGFRQAGAGSIPAEVAGKVTSIEVAETIETTGPLQAQPFASLTWNTSGVVKEVYVQSGDQVKAGDVLMKLKTGSVDNTIISAQATLVTAQKEMDDLLSTADADLAQAVIDLRTAQQAYVRASNYLEFLERSKTTPQTQAKMFLESINQGGKRYVFKTKVMKDPAPEDWFIDARNDLALKKAQLEDAQSTYDRFKNGADAQDLAAAQAKIDSAQALVDSMTIIAPFDGQVLYVANQPGDVVKTSEVAVNMANLDHLYIESQVDEANIVNIHMGDPVTAALGAVDGLVLTGRVAAVDPLGTVEAGSVLYTVWMDIDPISGGVFLPLAGIANVTIQVTDVNLSLAVPIAALQNDDGGEYVLVMQSDDTSERVDVISSTIVDDLVVVTGDLEEGDILMTAQNNALPAGGPFSQGD